MRGLESEVAEALNEQSLGTGLSEAKVPGAEEKWESRKGMSRAVWSPPASWPFLPPTDQVPKASAGGGQWSGPHPSQAGGETGMQLGTAG